MTLYTTNNFLGSSQGLVNALMELNLSVGAESKTREGGHLVQFACSQSPAPILLRLQALTDIFLPLIETGVGQMRLLGYVSSHPKPPPLTSRW